MEWLNLNFQSDMLNRGSKSFACQFHSLTKVSYFILSMLHEKMQRIFTIPFQLHYQLSFQSFPNPNAESESESE